MDGLGALGGVRKEVRRWVATEAAAGLWEAERVTRNGGLLEGFGKGYGGLCVCVCMEGGWDDEGTGKTGGTVGGGSGGQARGLWVWQLGNKRG